MIRESGIKKIIVESDSLFVLKGVMKIPAKMIQTNFDLSVRTGLALRDYAPS